MKRCDVKTEYTWKLEDIFESDELWLESLKDCEKYIEMTASYKGRLAEDPQTLLSYLRLHDEIELKLEELFQYSSRRMDEDLSNSKYRDMCTKIQNLAIRLGDAAAFDRGEILLAADKLDGYYKELPELCEYKRTLYTIVRNRDHILSEKEEALLTKASQMASAGDEIYAALCDADLTFPDVLDSEGNSHPLTEGTYIPYLLSSDRKLRRNAFNAYYDVYIGHKNTLAATLDSQVKQLKFYSKARNFKSNLEASLFRTEVPTHVYTNLISTVNSKLGYLHEYMELRRKALGLDEMHMYDLYTPIVRESDKKISFEEAEETVLRALAPLGEDYISYLKEGFDNRWIDRYENEGKRSGAYSAGARPHPYVLMNYNDTLEDLFTLAHEMGHALHSYYSMHNQPVNCADYVIFVAEVASTCNEVLLVKHLLAHTTDKKERAYLINHFLEQFRSTIYRQTMFAEFELRINELAEADNALTAELLNEEYYKLVKKYHGDAMNVDKKIEAEWERIPHFYMNFYVFQYATGFSAAVALAERILKEGAPAVADYKRFLSSGGSADPIALLKIAGVDMSSSKPVEDALEFFGELVKEMGELIG